MTSEEKKSRLQKHLREAMAKASYHKRMVFLDLYGGTGGVSRSLRQLGFAVLTFDLDLGAEFDLCDAGVISLICGWIKSGVVLGVMLAPPCGSWSRALTLWGHAVRSKESIYGLPGLLPHREVVRHLGNCTMKSAYRIGTCAVREGLPVILEQPCGSLMLETPEHHRLSRHGNFVHLHVDQCQWGARWRKRTALCFWNCVSISNLDRRCSGKHGRCCVTGKFHIQLMGKAPNGRNWTSLAQHYPRRLCSALAHILTSSSAAAIHSRRKLLFSGQ